MASEVTLNLRTSVPKPMIQRSGVKPAESLEANLVQIRDLITWLDTSASTSPLPSSWSSWQELRDASKFSDQVHVLDRVRTNKGGFQIARVVTLRFSNKGSDFALAYLIKAFRLNLKSVNQGIMWGACKK